MDHDGAHKKAFSHSYPHITPEIGSGARSQTVASGVYSLAQMIQVVCNKSGLILSAESVTLVNLDLSEDPDARPNI